MKRNWKLLFPDWSDYDRIWYSPRPFCLWPVGNQPFIGYWMDRAVEEEIDHITIYTADRPAEIRSFLNNGVYWSRSLEIIPIRCDDEAPDDAMPIVGLPKSNTLPSPIEGEAGLLRHWLRLNNEWLDTLEDYTIKIEIQHPSGGWVGPHTRIHPTAKLVSPFWIQGKCDVAPGAQIGPYACVGENTIIDEKAVVRNSIVLPGTMVGQNTTLDKVAVDGGLLLDSKHACRVAITDSFILSKIANKVKGPRLSERILALLLFCILSPIAALSRPNWSEIEAHDGRGGAMRLKTGEKGWLILRRFHWLKEVIKGRMRLVGILPRPINWESETTDQEMQKRLVSTPPGVISLSDAHDCHSPFDPIEWIHASYQTLSSDKNVSKIIRSQILRIAFKNAS